MGYLSFTRQSSGTDTVAEASVSDDNARVAESESLPDSTSRTGRLSGWRHMMALVVVRASASLRAEVSRSYLGYIWWVIEPTMYMAMFWLAFAEGLRGNGADLDYVAFLLCGLVTWKWFNSSFMAGGNSILGNKGLMLQVNLPKIVLPLSIIAANTFKFLITLMLLFIFLIGFGYYPTLSWLYVFPIFICQGIFIIGSTILLASLMPLLPDINSIMQNFILFMFFMSGIFFDISTKTGLVRKLFNINPMADILTAWRDALLHGQAPTWPWLGYVIILGVIFLLVGLKLMAHYEQRYAKLGG
jgi:lipopolysaccharide transport system permease protein